MARLGAIILISLAGVLGRGSAAPAAEAAAPAAQVRPGDDFYAYANAAWLAATRLPPGRDRYDTTAELRDRNARRVRDLVEEAAAHPASPLAQKVGDFYAAQLDAPRIEALGMAPLAGDLAAIEAIGDRRALSAYLGGAMSLEDGTGTHSEGVLAVWIHQGFHDPDHYVPHLMQGGLSLDRDAYLDAGPEAEARRAKLRAHVAAILKLAGLADPDVRAARVVALETALARTHASDADMGDVFKTDNSWRLADFRAKAPGLDWDAWFKAAGLETQKTFVVWAPSSVTGLAALVAAQPLPAWKDYLAFHAIERHAAVLPAALRDADAAFAGAPPPEPAQRALDATTAALGEGIGRLFVARYFPPADRAAAQAMAENLRAAFRQRIAGVPWFSPETRLAALAKLSALKLGVGYPDRWIDYSGLAIRRDDAFGDAARAQAFAYRQALAKLDRPVDPGEWGGAILPQAANVLINFSPNAIQVSAGLLQPPYFDPAGDAAANYGSAGAGLAHEISHSFDDLGNIYDDRGRLARWWTADDLARYQAATAPLARQLAAACPQPGLCVKGDQVLTESIADLAGLAAAYDAYHISLGGRADGVKDGLTGDQRFFLAYARRWRRVQTDAALRRQVATDTHLPPAERADLVRNRETWRRAYDVGPGDRLYLTPEESVPLW
ncbi:MAG: M13 family peptidase [Phenylobacterium sp.]|nr:MAG: M13 family peptidase [Phenylobacterium sp.]